MYALPAPSLQNLCRPWTGRLAGYRLHRNDEHLEALVADALRFLGLDLEAELAGDPYWGEAPLSRRVAVLLFLVDRGAVVRASRGGRLRFEAADDAETWAASQPTLAPYLAPTLALLSALRRHRASQRRAS